MKKALYPSFIGMSFFYSAGIQGSVKSIVSGMDKTKREKQDDFDYEKTEEVI